MNTTDDEDSSFSGSSGSRHDSESVSTSTSKSSASTSKLSKEEQTQLAARENQLVRRSRVVFVLLLLVLASVASGLTYYFTHREEKETFEQEVRTILNHTVIRRKGKAQFGPCVFICVYLVPRIRTLTWSFLCCLYLCHPFCPFLPFFPSLPHTLQRSKMVQHLTSMRCILRWMGSQPR
jgi:ribosomal protein L36